MRRAGYTLLWLLLLPLALLRLWWRGRREPGYRAHVGERFGRYGFAADRPVIWLHAVSVGETRAAAPLVAAVQARFPEHRLLITHTTPTGRATGETLFGDRVLRAWLPYDVPFAVNAFLRGFRPQLGLIMETEVWPNLIASCRDRGVPLWLVNARLSEKSARRYARFPRLAREAFSQLSGVCAQTERDAARIGALGAGHVVVCGNVKFDVTPPAPMLELGRTLRERFGQARPVFLAASTREGEEIAVLEAIRAMAVPGLLAVIVPRHPQRFDEVAALIRQTGLTVARRSEDRAVAAATRVVLGDSMGEMFAYYAACDVAFIGGSLMPLGGQNLIEACAVGTPVLVGPHTFNFLEATQQAVACGAALRVGDAASLAATAASLLGDPARRQAMAQAGRAFAAAHRGAVARTLQIVAPPE